MRQYIQGLAVALLLVLQGPGFSQPAVAGILDTEAALADRILGDENAPLTIIEYSSLGCPHCKAFHSDTFPMIKKEFIDTGKVRMIYRDYPLGARAMAAAMIARCAPAPRYFGMIELFFDKQQEWSQAEDALAALSKVAKFGGMSGDDVAECLKNQALLDGIRGRAEDAKFDFEIAATPSFLVGGEDGQKIEGALSAEDFRDVIQKALN
mgnify:FL=1